MHEKLGSSSVARLTCAEGQPDQPYATRKDMAGLIPSAVRGGRHYTLIRLRYSRGSDSPNVVVGTASSDSDIETWMAGGKNRTPSWP